MVLIETWFAWLSSMPTTVVVTLFIISVLKIKCAVNESHQTGYDMADNITLKKGNNIFTWCGIICLITFWFRSTIQSIVFTVLIAEDRHQENVGTSLGISWIFYGAGLWLMLLSFVLRIQYTFKGTHLEYSPIIIKVLYVMLCLLFIEIVLIAVISGFIPSMNKEGLIIAYIALISHFLFSVLLIYLLFSKIFITMQHRLRERLGSDVIIGSDVESGGVAAAPHPVGSVAAGDHQEMTRIDGDDDAGDNTENVEPTINQISLNSIRAVTRYALLMFIGIISTYIVSILIFIDIEYGWSVSYHILTWGATLVGFDLLINATAVYLLFEYNSSKYYQVCKICHIGCERCCVNVIYLYSKKSRNYGINANRNKQEFATLILAADDDNAII